MKKLHRVKNKVWDLWYYESYCPYELKGKNMRHDDQDAKFFLKKIKKRVRILNKMKNILSLFVLYTYYIE